jgi:hypothetical protein
MEFKFDTKTISKKVETILEGVSETIEKTFKDLEKTFEEEFTTTSKSEKIEVYGATPQKALEAANAKSVEGFKLESIEERDITNIANKPVKVWVAKLVKE